MCFVSMHLLYSEGFNQVTSKAADLSYIFMQTNKSRLNIPWELKFVT